MILETAVLDIKSGESKAFERAFAEASSIIAASPGCQRHEFRASQEKSDRDLLLVWWDTLESHTQGFRGSAAYEKWKSLLHHDYDPFPEVEHYRLVE